jgi:hypothetical protein
MHIRNQFSNHMSTFQITVCFVVGIKKMSKRWESQHPADSMAESEKAKRRTSALKASRLARRAIWRQTRKNAANPADHAGALALVELASGMPLTTAPAPVPEPVDRFDVEIADALGMSLEQMKAEEVIAREAFSNLSPEKRAEITKQAEADVEAFMQSLMK